MNSSRKAAGCLRTQAAKIEGSSASNVNQSHVTAQCGGNFLPAFGRSILPSCTEVRIYCGSKSWDKIAHCRANNCRLILPPGANSSVYRWPVQNCEVLILEVGHASDEELLALVREVLRQGASVARVFEALGRLSVHRKEVRYAAD